MIFRNLFKNFGQPAKSSSMVRVVQTRAGYVPYTQWLQQEQARIEAEKSARMPASAGEKYDLSFRVGRSQKETYDFSQ
jgi:hypothetical protein